MNKTFSDYGIRISSGRHGNVKVRCPQCPPDRGHPNDKSLSVNTNLGVWHCHYCGWKGGLGTVDTFTPRYKVREQKPKTYVKSKFDPTKETLSENGRAFLNKRGITDEVIARYGIVTKRVWIPATEKEESALLAPYTKNGEVVNYKARTSKKDFAMEKGCESVLYGFDDIVEDDVLLWSEGEFDKWAFAVAGIYNCVSVPNGAREKTFDCFISAEHKLASVTAHLIAVDKDENGRILQAELIRRLGPSKCYIVEFPEDCKDANDVLLKHGAETLWRCYAEAQPVPMVGYIEPSSVWDEVIDLYENGLRPGPEFSDPELSKLYRARPGELSLVTGIPGSGKSRWLDYILYELARLHGWHHGVFSPENRVARHIARLLALYWQKPFRDGPRPRMTRWEIDQAKDWIDEHFVFFMPEDDMSLENILELAGAAVQRRGIRGLVLDPYNEFDSDRDRAETETSYINRFLKKIKQFCRTRDVHTWLVAHPKQLQKDKNGDYPVPTPYDISGSAHWRNRADMAVSVWRDLSPENQTNEVQIHFQKVRFEENGEIGMLPMRFDIGTGMYWSIREAETFTQSKQTPKEPPAWYGDTE